jgi:hypothetical protein
VPAFLSASQAAQLRKIARRYKKKAKLGKPWSKRTDDDLWRKVLGQIAVVGRAEPGERLQNDPKVKPQVSIQRLKRLRTDAQLQKYLHGVFVRLGVRYVGSSWKKDKKAAAAVANFRKLTGGGNTPRKFFEQIAKCKTEE